MNRQRALSILTFLLGLYGVWGLTQLLSSFGMPGVWPHVVPDFVTAVCGLLGGILLWKGAWLGYLSSAVGWTTTLVTGVNLNAAGAGSGVFISVAAVVSIPVLVVFYLAIRDKKRNENT